MSSRSRQFNVLNWNSLLYIKRTYVVDVIPSAAKESPVSKQSQSPKWAVGSLSRQLMSYVGAFFLTSKYLCSHCHSERSEGIPFSKPFHVS